MALQFATSATSCGLVTTRSDMPKNLFIAYLCLMLAADSNRFPARTEAKFMIQKWLLDPDLQAIPGGFAMLNQKAGL